MYGRMEFSWRRGLSRFDHQLWRGGRLAWPMLANDRGNDHKKHMPCGLASEHTRRLCQWFSHRQSRYPSFNAADRIDATLSAVDRPIVIPRYNGCAEWGGFEEHQIAFLVRHDRSGQKRWIPAPSTECKEGKQSAVLPGGTTTLPPILYTATVPHRFSCFMKAPQPTIAQLHLAGESRSIQVGTDWTSAEVELTVPHDLMGGLTATITIPNDTVVLLDAVSHRPLGAADRRSDSSATLMFNRYGETHTRRLACGPN